MFKKLVSGIIIVFLLTPSLTIASAEENTALNEKDLNQYLINHNYPQSLIDTYDIEQKQELYDEKATLVSIETRKETVVESTYGMTLEQKRHVSEQIPQKNSITTQAQSGDLNNFTHTISMSKVASSTAGLTQYVVNYNWDWNYDPVFTRTDQFALAWTDDWDVVDNSAKYSYKAFGRRGSDSAIGSTAGNPISGARTSSPGAGVGWQVNLVNAFSSNGISYDVFRHKGWGTVKLSKAKNTSGHIDQSSIVGKYFHQRAAVNGELSFSPTPGIAISWGTQYDESNAVSKTWTW